MQSKRFILTALVLVSVLSLSCAISDLLPDSPDGAPTSDGSAPGETITQVPPTESPPTPDPALVFWQSIAGMWSGCPADAGGGIFLDICSLGSSGFPIGPFITLSLPPVCNVGDVCGLYVKGAFESEYIPFELTLQALSGNSATFYADPGSGMFSGLDRTMEVTLSNGQLFIVESEGESYYLSAGCNPIIDSSFQCLTAP